MLTDHQQQQLIQETFLRSTVCQETLDSTNDAAKRLIQPGHRLPPTLVICRHQSHGRGRGGNVWHSGDGALTFSLILPASQLGLAQYDFSPLSLWTALGVRSALASVCGPALPFTVKWPNDVFCIDNKVAGILIESLPRQDHYLIVGIGINVNNQVAGAGTASPPLPLTAISLAEAAGTPYSCFEVLKNVIEQLQSSWDTMRSMPSSLPQRWEPHCRLNGQRVTLEADGVSITGLCTGVAVDGALLLSSDGTITAHSHGTVRIQATL